MTSQSSPAAAVPSPLTSLPALSSMTSPIIRTRAAEDDAPITLQLPSSSPFPPSPTPPPSSSSPLDALWSSYSSYLDSALTSLTASLTIHPAPSFTIKSSLTPHPPSSPPSPHPLPTPRKLFINVCTHPAVDPPAVEAEGGESPAGGEGGKGGRVRVPMSVGPVGPGVDRGGQPCLIVDVVVHPSAIAVEPLPGGQGEELHRIAQGQAALLARREGGSGEVRVPTPAEVQAMAMGQVRRTLAAIALGKVREKYGVEVGAEEPRFPKRAYQGPLPPPSQNIRRNPNNPLHRLPDSSAKSLIEEMPAPPAPTAPTQPALPSESTEKVERGMKAGSGVAEGKVREEKQRLMEEEKVMERKEAEPGVIAVAPHYDLTLSKDGRELTLQVHLPGLSSSAEADVSLTADDVHLTTTASPSHAAYSLHVTFSVRVDEDRAEAKFNKKKQTLSLRLPIIAAPALLDSSAASETESKSMPLEEKESQDRDKLHNDEQAVTATTHAEGVDSPTAQPVIDWVARLSLRNPFISQSSCI